MPNYTPTTQLLLLLSSATVYTIHPSGQRLSTSRASGRLHVSRHRNHRTVVDARLPGHSVAAITGVLEEYVCVARPLCARRSVFIVLMKAYKAVEAALELWAKVVLFFKGLDSPRTRLEQILIKYTNLT